MIDTETMENHFSSNIDKEVRQIFAETFKETHGRNLSDYEMNLLFGSGEFWRFWFQMMAAPLCWFMSWRYPNS